LLALFLALRFQPGALRGGRRLDVLDDARPEIDAAFADDLLPLREGPTRGEQERRVSFVIGPISSGRFDPIAGAQELAVLVDPMPQLFPTADQSLVRHLDRLVAADAIEPVTSSRADTNFSITEAASAPSSSTSARRRVFRAFARPHELDQRLSRDLLLRRR
jgi:hypothetical protein